MDQDGKVTVQGSSKLESEVGEEPESHGSGEAQEGGGAKPELSAGMSYASDGTWAASVSGKVDADYEGFVPEASAEISAVYDPAKRSWETRVHASTAMGMGVSLGGASLECFPGEVSVEFEPRAVLDDAAAYVDALSRT
ncbi:MAG TPA: hypothetical protein VLS49_06240 [Usitatibacter sp.]|nr:hypothetical protein [Usitatibacter sp.]